MIDDKRYVGVFSLEALYTLINAAYAVHPDIKSHTGRVVSFGKGMINCRSSKQKLNTTSSTEVRIVGVSD